MPKSKNLSLISNRHSGKVSQKFKQQLGQETSIVFGEWQQFGISEQIRKIDQWKSREIYLYKNGYSMILRELQFVQFPQLTKISLTANNIYSIEPISRMKIPNLKILWIGCNNICSVESIRKVESSQLQSLVIRRNHISQIGGLNEGNWENINLISISSFPNDPHNVHEMNKLCKIKSKNITKVQACSQKSIYNKKLHDVLKNINSKGTTINICKDEQ